VPVKIEAIASEGYNFLHWGNNGLIPDTLNAVFLDTLNTYTINFDAYFEEITTSTAAVEKSYNFSLYPNPANNILYLKSNGTLNNNLQYQIIDVNGRIIKEGILPDGNAESEIGIGSIPASVYILQISNSKGILKQFRFIKTGE
jgi:hypothetical protein